MPVAASLAGKQDRHALMARRIRVANLARGESLAIYRPSTITNHFLRELVGLSYLDAGPLLAKEFLNKSGIHLVWERHLPKTHLDGAAMKLPDGSPVVALTLRHDRLDSFWFTLLHELAHVARHLDNDDIDVFFDDLAERSKTQCEREADEFAAEALIPRSLWKSAGLSKLSPSGHRQEVRRETAHQPCDCGRSNSVRIPQLHGL